MTATCRWLRSTRAPTALAAFPRRIRPQRTRVSDFGRTGTADESCGSDGAGSLLPPDTRAMSPAELLIPAPLVPVGETPQGSSDDAQPAGGRSPRGGLFGGMGTVEDELTRLEIRLLAGAGGDPVAEQDVRRC